MNKNILESKINRLIYQIRNEIFPPDDNILKNINNITIIYDEKLTNSKHILSCPIYNKFANPRKRNKFESIIIITSIFLLKYLTTTTHLFIDATIKIDL